jgi:CRP-like cAMP-binding protein
MASLLTLTFSQPTRNLASGEILITEGDPGGSLYVLESGKLVVERDGVAIATIAEPGALIGEMSVLNGTPNSATVRATAASSVRVVKDALAFLERQPAVALRVATLLSRRLDATSALLAELKHEHKGTPTEQSIFTRLMTTLFTPGRD